MRSSVGLQASCKLDTIQIGDKAIVEEHLQIGKTPIRRSGLKKPGSGVNRRQSVIDLGDFGDVVAVTAAKAGSAQQPAAVIEGGLGPIGGRLLGSEEVTVATVGSQDEFLNGVRNRNGKQFFQRVHERIRVQPRCRVQLALNRGLYARSEDFIDLSWQWAIGDAVEQVTCGQSLRVTPTIATAGDATQGVVGQVRTTKKWARCRRSQSITEDVPED